MKPLFGTKLIFAFCLLTLVGCGAGQQQKDSAPGNESEATAQCVDTKEKLLRLNGRSAHDLMSAIVVQSNSNPEIDLRLLQSCLDRELSIQCRINEFCKIERR